MIWITINFLRHLYYAGVQGEFEAVATFNMENGFVSFTHVAANDEFGNYRWSAI